MLQLVNIIHLANLKREDEDTVILDARNDYEFDLGHFRGAIRPDITPSETYQTGFVRTKIN